ncbi:MAG: DMT family transporter [Phycisphaerales bacterium]
MSDLRGVMLVVVSALGFGFMALFKSWAAPGIGPDGAPTPGASTETILALRFTIASVVLFGIALVRGLALPRGRTLGTLVFMGAVLYFGEAACYFFAIDAGAPSGLVALLLYLYPGMVACLAWVLFRERLRAMTIAAIALGLVGSALTVGLFAGDADGPLAGTPMIGIALGVSTAVVYAVYILVGSRLPAGASKISASAVVTGSAAVSFWVVALWRSGGEIAWPPDAVGWLGITLLALVSTVVSITALLAGLARIGAVRASALSIIEPATTVVVGWLLLGEALTPGRLVGALLILVAAVMAARPAR